MVREWLTKREAATELKCSTRQIERFTEDRKLRKKMEGRTPMFSAGDVERIRSERLSPDTMLPLEFGALPAPTGALVPATKKQILDDIAMRRLLAAFTPPEPAEPKPLYCGIREAAKITGLPAKVVREVFMREADILDEQLRCYTVGERLLVNRADLEKL